MVSLDSEEGTEVVVLAMEASEGHYWVPYLHEDGITRGDGLEHISANMPHSCNERYVTLFFLKRHCLQAFPSIRIVY